MPFLNGIVVFFPCLLDAISMHTGLSSSDAASVVDGNLSVSLSSLSFSSPLCFCGAVEPDALGAVKPDPGSDIDKIGNVFCGGTSFKPFCDGNVSGDRSSIWGFGGEEGFEQSMWGICVPCGAGCE